jgi:hypothetical protein
VHDFLKTFVLSTLIGVILLLPPVFAGFGNAQFSDATAIFSPSPTMTLPLTPSPTPFVTDDAIGNQRCLMASWNDDPLPDVPIDALVNRLDIEPLLDFFNHGGQAETLRTALSQSRNQMGPYLSQVIEQDITGDAIPEIFVAVTRALTSGGYGESRLLMLQCVDGSYQEWLLFLRAGAGQRGEGLYSGGGAHILSIADLNSNGARELVFTVDWSDEYGEFAEVYVLEWQDGTFHPIVEYQDDLQGTIHFIRSYSVGSFSFIDSDGDGLYELVVDGITYRWDGEVYRADGETD